MTSGQGSVFCIYFRLLLGKAAIAYLLVLVLLQCHLLLCHRDKFLDISGRDFNEVGMGLTVRRNGGAEENSAGGGVQTV